MHMDSTWTFSWRLAVWGNYLNCSAVLSTNGPAKCSADWQHIYIYIRVISHLPRVDIGLRSKPYEKPHFIIEQEWITTPMLSPYFQSTGPCEFQAESQSGMLPSPNWHQLIFQRLLSMIKNQHWRSNKEGFISTHMSSCKHNKDMSCLQWLSPGMWVNTRYVTSTRGTSWHLLSAN